MTIGPPRRVGVRVRVSANHLKSVIVASHILSIYLLALNLFCFAIYLANLKLKVLIKALLLAKFCYIVKF